MADKPSRALVIVGDGFAPHVRPSHAHIHSFASRAASGFISLRSPPPNETESDRIVRELAQILDAYDSYAARTEERDPSDADVNRKAVSLPTLAERFMGMRAALVTNSVSVASFARDIGLDVLQIAQLVAKADLSHELLKLPEDLVVVHKILKLLGFSSGVVLEKSEYDMVLLHIRAGDKVEDQKGKMVAKLDIDWLDKIIGGLLQTVQPGSNVASRLHTSILLSYGTIPDSDKSCSLDLSCSVTDTDLSLLRPRQSYMTKDGHLLNDIRHHHPLLLAQLQEGVTRRDLSRSFYFEEFKQRGGNLAILADRVLHEVAFKLWKAPKYGA